MLIFFGTAWLNWDGRQAVLWNLAEHRYYIFGATFWPQDFILLSALLIICAFGLFTITVSAGRVWCGYSCPQSVWTWMFMWAGEAHRGRAPPAHQARRRALVAGQAARRSAKHGLWLAVSLLTALTFVGYFTPIRPLALELFTLAARRHHRRSGCSSSPPPPTSTPAGCARRSAATCAPTRASRA